MIVAQRGDSGIVRSPAVGFPSQRTIRPHSHLNSKSILYPRVVPLPEIGLLGAQSPHRPEFSAKNTYGHHFKSDL
jgi:hypothetical protein